MVLALGETTQTMTCMYKLCNNLLGGAALRSHSSDILVTLGCPALLTLMCTEIKNKHHTHSCQ